MPEQSKTDLIAGRQANLPLPNDPPVASDWNSADARTVNIEAGERQDELPAGGSVSTGNTESTGLREPASKGSGAREDGGADLSGVGRQGKDGLSGLPKDATK
ncbi:hypothetical protein BJ875DRAFT_457143 [Amylocarpus encephaloides]|uniref:Uncharacterized protein n=1 Tax=Amylocarpus encephaloides TaxID=45428 RepID=A0A9P8C711_9HELO|nr:hypothetical protein BJ875DRAFT_457143 [Amylocarpus encephaloides]